jgi:hypothetical protein
MTFLVPLACCLVTIPFTALATRSYLIRLPADYLVRPRRSWRDAWRGSGWRKLGTVARNLAGTALLVAGGVMLIPPVPGPGLLTLLLGLSLVDFPAKLSLQCRVLQTGRLRSRIDRLRARSGRPPLEFPSR